MKEQKLVVIEFYEREADKVNEYLSKGWVVVRGWTEQVSTATACSRASSDLRGRLAILLERA